MYEVLIKLDYSHGPIWQDKYNAETDVWSTGIPVIDNDKTLAFLNEKTCREYSSLYFANDQGVITFDQEAFEKKKSSLASLIETLIKRLNSINDGSFIVVNELKFYD